MAKNYELTVEIGAAIAEVLGSTSVTENPEYNSYKIRGITRNNFAVWVKQMTTGQWRMNLERNGNEVKVPLLEEMFVSLADETDFTVRDSKWLEYEYSSMDINELMDAAQQLREFIDRHDLGSAKVVESRLGVPFQGTQFDRLKERGATISGMFGNLVCQASGMDLLMMQAEYYVDAGEIDGVEFNESGDVVSIYECQAGIHKGQALDELHLNKALGSYLYDREVIPTVRKVVVLAGAYEEDTLIILRERAYELSRREKAIELVVLVTTRVENRIGVERVVL